MNKSNIKTLAGIVSFNPDIDRLGDNIKSIVDQVDRVVVVDNGSKNFAEVISLSQKFNGVKLIKNNKNLGIAKALKQIMEFAMDNSFDWVLTLDCDSVAKSGLIGEYKKFIDLPNVGLITCVLKDRHHEVSQQIFNDKNQKYMTVPTAITSGSFMKVDAYKKTHGYDEDLFIDWVDMDICLDLKLCGYNTIKINFVGLITEISYTKLRKFLWRTLLINNYSAFRRYYRVRNEIIVADRYPQLYKRYSFISNFVPTFIKILIYEDDKVNKLKNIFKGRKDGHVYLRNCHDNSRKSELVVNEIPEKIRFHF